VHEVFDRVIKNWDDQFNTKAYLHVYEQDGISASDMLESRSVMQDISDQYCEFARWEDKFFDGDPCAMRPSTMWRSRTMSIKAPPVGKLRCN